MAELAFTFPLANRPWLRRTLGVLLFLAAFGFFTYWTFPYEALARRIESEAAKSGSQISLRELGPAGLLGVRAQGLTVRLAPDPQGNSTELKLDRLDLKPALLGLLVRRVAVDFVADAFAGRARGVARVSSDPKAPGLQALQLELEGLDLKALPPSLTQELELLGRLGAKGDLTSLNKLEEASGNLALTLSGGALVKGKLDIPGMGPLTLPKVAIGDLSGSVSIDKGNAKVEKLSVRGGDFDADVDGTIRLKPLLMLSQAELHVRFKPQDKWLEQNPLIKGSLGFLGPKGPDGYSFTLSGTLNRLATKPGR
jgi:type II secretion system protein N